MSRGTLEAIVLVQAIISVVSDFTFATLPILFLWRVQVDFTTKVGLWVLMCLGFITGSFCLVRTVLNNESLPFDATYGGIVNWVWRLFEVTIGIVAACIPTLRPLYIWIMKRIRGNRSGLDENIRYPMGSQKHSIWIDNVENARRSASDEESGNQMRENSPREQLGFQDILVAEQRSPSNDRRNRHRDTMKDDLVNEGIINPNADSRTMSPTKSPVPRSRGRASLSENHAREKFLSEDVQSSKARSGASPATIRGSYSRERRDHMRDDLINEGIINPGASSSGKPLRQSVTEDSSYSTLDEEMHRFGINTSIRK